MITLITDKKTYTWQPKIFLKNLAITAGIVGILIGYLIASTSDFLNYVD